jgi:hypothetical protein
MMSQIGGNEYWTWERSPALLTYQKFDEQPAIGDSKICEIMG